ncbi:MAG: ATP-binding protein [Moraxella sp.]|nr:ATP-binding protein [Moraxella sp.]
MALFSLTERSIFFKIYAGLLLVCSSVALFSYLFVTTINGMRIQAYREDAISGIFYLLGEGLERQPIQNREFWLKDASGLFGDNFRLIAQDSVDFKAKEIRRLADGKAVVRHDGVTNYVTVYYKIKGSDELLYLKATQLGDRQARAMAIFLLDDLSHYPSLAAKRGRLDVLSKRLGYPVRLQNVQDLQLDSGQVARIKSGDIVLAFYDGAASQNATVSVIAPSEVQGMAIVAGPIPLFHWFPPNLLISTALLAMLLMSLGVYMLIFPLERRLGLLQAGVSQVAKGRLDTKVQVVGQDDIARLSATFNNMIMHIKRLIESQRELTRAVSHELRTPVARIRFAVDMLADENDYESRQMQKQYIDEDIESLNELIDEILTYAKLEEGSPKLDWQMVNLRELIEQIVKETNALGKPIKVDFNLPAPKVMVMADRRYLHRVIQNFAGNALRYAKSTIIISAWVEKNTAFVSVEDDGQGISEEDRDKVFIPFARLDDSRTRASGGYGLGLSIVSRIAFWFNGQATVDESPTLGGARFSMSWPVKQVGVSILADEITQVTNEKIVIGDE